MFCQSLTRYACEVLPYRSHMYARPKTARAVSHYDQEERSLDELEKQRQQLELQRQHYQRELAFEDFSAAVGGEEGLQETLAQKAELACQPEVTIAEDGAASAEDVSDEDSTPAPSQQEAVDCMRRVLGLAEILGE